MSEDWKPERLVSCWSEFISGWIILFEIRGIDSANPWSHIIQTENSFEKLMQFRCQSAAAAKHLVQKTTFGLPNLAAALRAAATLFLDSKNIN